MLTYKNCNRIWFILLASFEDQILEHNLLSQVNCFIWNVAAKLEMLLEEKLVEAHTSANHIRTLEVRLQEANQNIGAIHRKSNQPRKSVSASLDAESEEDSNMQLLTASSDLDVTRLQVCPELYKFSSSPVYKPVICIDVHVI